MNERILNRVEPKFSAWQREITFDSKRYRHRKDKGEPIREQVRPLQRVLERQVRSGPAGLARYLRGSLGLEPQEQISAPAFPRMALTPNEYLNPPIPLERELGRAWAKPVSARWASRPVFWLLCHIEWIEHGRLGAGDLTAALLAAPSNPDLEGRIRNLLRRTGGIPYVRGKTSVFSDCTLARAWWRYRLSQEIEAVTDRDVSAATAHEVLHANRPAWETLVMLSLRRLTVLNQPRARAAIVRELSARLREDGTINKDQVRAAAIAIARVGLRHSVDHLGHTALANITARALPRRKSPLRVTARSP